jgi:nitroreductase
MELFDVIKGRRAVRKFKERRIPIEDLKKIMESGIWAPSGSNIQPWEFILVKDKVDIEKIKMISPGLFGEPAALVIVCINKKRTNKAGKQGSTIALMDISMASQNMMLMAYSLNIGSCPVVSFNKTGVQELMDIPNDVKPVLIISFGYPEFWPVSPQRRPLKEIIHIGKYGEHFK